MMREGQKEPGKKDRKGRKMYKTLGLWSRGQWVCQESIRNSWSSYRVPGSGLGPEGLNQSLWDVASFHTLKKIIAWGSSWKSPQILNKEWGWAHIYAHLKFEGDVIGTNNENVLIRLTQGRQSIK